MEHPERLRSSLGPSIAASVVTATLLYPLDYYKSLLQLTYGNSSVNLPNQPKYFFSGLSGVNVSVFFKAFTRFGTFNYFNRVFNSTSSQANPGVLISSLFAGIAESIAIVPFENIKLNLILSSLYNSLPGNRNPFRLPETPISKKGIHTNDIFAASPPKGSFPKGSPPKGYTGDPLFVSKHFFDSIRKVYQRNGMYGFFKGTNVTLVRQCSNSICFFGTYNSLKQLLDPKNNSESNVLKFILNMGASVVIVGANQPIDMIKTRFQADVYPQSKYKNSLDCAYKIYIAEGGIAKLYAGWLPRLVKVSVSGSVMMIFFNYFEKMM